MQHRFRSIEDPIGELIAQASCCVINLAVRIQRAVE
jgi:hypothetical protein